MCTSPVYKMTPARPRPLVQIPITPPPMYANQFSTPPLSTSSTFATPSTASSSQFFSPASPVLVTPKAEREIIMGGLVSRSPSFNAEEEHDLFSEKRQGSIEVPGIVLTEPIPDLPPRSPSPPLKSITLLQPASLPIPLENPVSQHRPFSPAFLQILHGNRSGGKASTTLKTLLLVGGILLGGWHLYTSLQAGSLDETGAL